MVTQFNKLPLSWAAATSLALSFVSSDAAATERYDEFVPIVEINATDGDVGFHVLLDGTGWDVAKIYRSNWDRIFKANAFKSLNRQGLTELFMESAEPLCWNDPEADPEDLENIVTVEDFVNRFAAGTYYARGRDLAGEVIKGSGQLTHDLPAAPIVNIDAGLDVDGNADVTISWQVGVDLGNCAYPEGLITDPGDVEVVRWEIVVEPDEDAVEEADLEDTVFVVQFHGDAPMSVDVPAEFFGPYLDAGVTDFKGEVGAREESGNQTFTEIEFTVE